MTPAARLAAAIDVFTDIETRRRPAPDALKDWGLAHRFAGSGDRAAIAGLVYDALRRRASAAWIMDAATPRAILLGMLHIERGFDAMAIAKLADGGRFAPAPLSSTECAALSARTLDDAPAHVAGDFPEWLDLPLARVFGDDRVAEAAALAHRAPLDLRVNTLKADRTKVLDELGHHAAKPTPWSPLGVRITVAADAKSPPIHAEPCYLKGHIEVQDEGSQLATLLTGAKPGEKVVDLCAGAGGKTLALAAMMDNHGQIFASDLDLRRLAPIHARLQRAGVRNTQVRTPRREEDALADVAERADLVLIDAPCTGTGSWRRNPDAKWRVRPGALAARIKEQAELLNRAVSLLKPAGRIAYVTCSVLAEENTDQVLSFLSRHPEFRAAPDELLAALGDNAPAFRQTALTSPEGVLMTPRRTGTDGFFVALLRR